MSRSKTHFITSFNRSFPAEWPCPDSMERAHANLLFPSMIIEMCWGSSEQSRLRSLERALTPLTRSILLTRLHASRELTIHFPGILKILNLSSHFADLSIDRPSHLLRFAMNAPHVKIMSAESPTKSTSPLSGLTTITCPAASQTGISMWLFPA